MPRLARSAAPLYITRGRPFSFPMRLTGPSGAAIDLTGATLTAQFQTGSVEVRVGALITNAPDGRLVVSAQPSDLVNLRTEMQAKLVVSIVDSQGVPFDFVYPVTVEAP